MPFELRPYPTPTLKPEGEYLQMVEQDIGDIDVLTKLAGEIGFNKEEFKKALETRKI
jgi:hypothetical protein